jgi:hypothetical protein
MIKALLILSVLCGAIAIACGSSNKSSDPAPAPTNTNRSTSSSTSSTTSQAASDSSGSEDAENASAKEKLLGTIELKAYHDLEKTKNGIYTGNCFSFSKMPPAPKGGPTPIEGPCPDFVKVGPKKTNSIMLVACPPEDVDGFKMQPFIYENIIVIEKGKEVTKSAKDFLSIKAKDTPKALCEKFLKLTTAET